MNLTIYRQAKEGSFHTHKKDWRLETFLTSLPQKCESGLVIDIIFQCDLDSEMLDSIRQNILMPDIVRFLDSNSVCNRIAERHS